MYPRAGTIGNRDGLGGLEWAKEGMFCIEFDRQGWAYFPKQKGLEKPAVGCPVMSFRRLDFEIYKFLSLRVRMAVRYHQFRKVLWRLQLRYKSWTTN